MHFGGRVEPRWGGLIRWWPHSPPGCSRLVIDALSAHYMEREAPRALVLSDVHGHCGLSRALRVAAAEAPVDVLVLLGDFCEPHRAGGSCQEWRLAVSRVARASGARLVVYIEGNHDGGASKCLEGVAHYIGESYTLSGSENAYLLTHGHLYERDWLEECLWTRGFTTPESDSCVIEWGRRVRRALGLPGSMWLVLGHTHRLILDYRARVIHAGALCERVLSRLSLPWERSLGYLVVRDQWIEARRIDPTGRVVASLHSWPRRIPQGRGGGGGLLRAAYRLLARLRRSRGES